MTAQEYENKIREYFAEAARYHAEIARNQAEADIRQEKARQEFEEYKKIAKQRSAAIDRQIAGLSDKFGSFTEGMALPSMEKILREQFHMDVIAPSVRVSCNGRNMELDVLAYSDRGIDEVYIVEVKSHLKERSLQQLQRALKSFPDFFPRFRGLKLYGILAAVDASSEMRRRVLRHGIYFAWIKDDVFRLDIPEGFRPQAFPNPGPAPGGGKKS